MAYTPRKDTSKASAALPAAAGAEVTSTAAKKKFKRRFAMQRYPDGSYRAVRLKSSFVEERDQSLSDFYGEQPALSIGANVRSMDAILGEISSNLKLEENEGIAPELLAAAWAECMGDFLGSQASLVSLSHGRAQLRCTHPAVRYELTKHKRKIIKFLNARFGEDCVKKLYIL